MTYTVEVRSVDLNVTLPSTALYQVGATVVLADGDYDVIPQDYIAHHLTVTDASPGTPLSHPAPSGGSTQVPVAKTSAYTAANGDVVLANASGANFTVTLPAPASAIAVTVKNVGATGTVTIAPHAAEHIDGAASLVLSSQFESRDLLSDGTDWWVL